MGVHQKTTSFKWDPETARMCDELQEKFAPFVGSRSQTIRLVIKLMHRIVLTTGVQTVVVNHLRTNLEQRAEPRDVNTER